MKAVKLFVTLAVLVIAGCVRIGEETALVYIDGEPAIPANLYSRAYKTISAEENEGRPLTYERAKTLLDDVITADVLVREAEAAGFTEDEEYKGIIKKFADRTLRTHLDEWAREQVRVSEKELRRMYDLNQNRRPYSVIYNPRRDLVEEAMAKLDEGAPFAEVATEYSKDRAAAITGGHSPDPLPYSGDVYSDALYALKNPGDITGVLSDANKYYYVILKLEEEPYGLEEENADGPETPEGAGESPGGDAETAKETKPAAKTYEEMAEKYDLSIRYRKSAELLDEMLDAYIAKKAPQYDAENYEVLLNKSTKELEEEYLGRGLTLATVAGRELPLDEALNEMLYYLQLSPEESDDYKTKSPDYFKEKIDATIQRLLRNKVRADLARELGLDRTPRFKLDYYRKKGEELVSRFYENVFLPTVFDPTEEELRAYYAEHVSEYGEPERMLVKFAAVYDEAKASEWRERVVRGESFESLYDDWRSYHESIPEEIRAEHDPREVFNQGKEYYKDPKLQPTSPFGPAPHDLLLMEEVFKYGEGKTSPVIPLNDGRFLFFYNAKYTPPSDKPYEEVADEVRLDFQNEVVSRPETDARIQEWFALLRAKHEIVIDEKVFRAVYEQLSSEETTGE